MQNSFSLFNYNDFFNGKPEDNDTLTGPYKIESLSAASLEKLNLIFKRYEECYAYVKHYPSFKESIEGGENVGLPPVCDDVDCFKTAKLFAKRITKIQPPQDREVQKQQLYAEMLNQGRFAYYPASALLEAAELLQEIEASFTTALSGLDNIIVKWLQKIGTPFKTALSDLDTVSNFKTEYKKYLQNQLKNVSSERSHLLQTMLGRLKWISTQKTMLDPQSHEFPDGLIPFRLVPSISDHFKNFPKISLKTFSALHLQLAADDFFSGALKEMFWITAFSVDLVVKKQFQEKLLVLVPGPRGSVIEYCNRKNISLLYKGPSIEDWMLYQLHKIHLENLLQTNGSKEEICRVVDQMSSLLLKWKHSEEINSPLLDAWCTSFAKMFQELVGLIQNDSLFSNASLKDSSNSYLLILLPNFKELISVIQRNILTERLKVHEKAYLEETPFKIKTNPDNQLHLALFQQGWFLSSPDRQPSFEICIKFLTTATWPSFKSLKENLEIIWPQQSTSILRSLFQAILNSSQELNVHLINFIEEQELKKQCATSWLVKHTSHLNTCVETINDAFSWPPNVLVESQTVLQSTVLQSLETLQIYKSYYDDSYIKLVEEHLLKEYIPHVVQPDALLTDLLLFLKSLELNEMYGKKYLNFFVTQNLVGMVTDERFARLCDATPALMQSASEEATKFIDEHFQITTLVPIFVSWDLSKKYLEQKREPIGELLISELKKMYHGSIEDFDRVFHVLIFFRFQFSGTSLNTLQAFLDEIRQEKWTGAGMSILEELKDYMSFEKLQAYRLKWLKGFVSSQIKHIPTETLTLIGFDDLRDYFGLLNIPHVLQTLQDICPLLKTAPEVYSLLGIWLYPTPQPKDQDALRIYERFLSLSQEMRETLLTHFSIIEEVMSFLEKRDNDSVALKIKELADQIPPSPMLTNQQEHARKILNIIVTQIEEWMIKKISQGDSFGDLIKALKTICRTEFLRSLCISDKMRFIQKNRFLIGTFYREINKLQQALRVYEPLDSFWYRFLIHPQLFSLLNCLSAQAKQDLALSLNQISVNSPNKQLKNVCWKLYSLLMGHSFEIKEFTLVQLILQLFIKELEHKVKHKNYNKAHLLETIHFALFPFIAPQEEPEASSSHEVPSLKFRSEMLKDFPELKTLNNLQIAVGKSNDDIGENEPEINRWHLVLNNILRTNEMRGSRAIESASSGKRFLHPSILNTMFDENGMFRLNNCVVSPNQHKVFKIDVNRQSVYFKFLPDAIGLQMLSIKWQKVFFGDGLQMELLKFPRELSHETMAYPVQVSLEVPGETVAELWNKQETFQIDHKSFSQNFLRLLFENEQDGKPENYIAVGDGLVKTLQPIDNEQGFGPASISTKNWFGWLSTELHVVSLIFCLDEMLQPLNPEIINKFLALDPKQVLLELLQDAERQRNVHRNIFNQSEIDNLYNHKKLTIDPIFTEKRIKEWFVNFVRLQDLLHHDPEATALSLFQVIHPEAALFYQPLFDQYSTPQGRFAFISQKTNRHRVIQTTVDAKRQYITSRRHPEVLQSILEITPNSASVIREKNLSPQNALDCLHSLIVQFDHLEKIQQQMMAGNVKAFSELHDNYFKTAVVNGIEGKYKAIQFENLTDEQQTAILNAMQGISWGTLNLKGCKTTLTDEVLGRLIQSSPNLQSLDISGCKRISNKLGSLLRKCSKLKVLILNDLEITELFIRDTTPSKGCLPELRYLSIKNNNSLKTLEIDTPKLKKIEVLDCPQLFKVHIRCSPDTLITILGSGEGEFNIGNWQASTAYDHELIRSNWQASAEYKPYRDELTNRQISVGLTQRNDELDIELRDCTHFNPFPSKKLESLITVGGFFNKQYTCWGIIGSDYTTGNNNRISILCEPILVCHDQRGFVKTERGWINIEGDDSIVFRGQKGQMVDIFDKTHDLRFVNLSAFQSWRGEPMRTSFTTRVDAYGAEEIRRRMAKEEQERQKRITDSTPRLLHRMEADSNPWPERIRRLAAGESYSDMLPEILGIDPQWRQPKDKFGTKPQWSIDPKK